MIVSRYLSEPEAHDPGSTPHAGSESFTRLSKGWRVIRRGLPFSTFLFGNPGEPFKRLEFWTASHPLSFKLRLYSVSEPKINMWQGFTWETLRYWRDLMSGEEPQPDPQCVSREWLERLHHIRAIETEGALEAWYARSNSV